MIDRSISLTAGCGACGPSGESWLGASFVLFPFLLPLLACAAPLASPLLAFVSVRCGCQEVGSEAERHDGAADAEIRAEHDAVPRAVQAACNTPTPRSLYTCEQRNIDTTTATTTTATDEISSLSKDKIAKQKAAGKKEILINLWCESHEA